MTDVVLGFGPIMMATNIAAMRRASNAIKRIPPKHGAPVGAGSWEMDIMACQAEVAVACYLNLFWSGTLNDFAARDVGGLIDVRSTSAQERRLILHDDDPDAVPFVLVWAHCPTFALQGWCFGHEGKRKEFWSDPQGNRPAYFVPREGLRPMPALKEWLKDLSEVTTQDAA